MPPVFGPLIAVVGALVVLRRGERQRASSPSTSAKKLASSPRRNSSITSSAPASPNAPPKQASIAASASACVVGDGHALAGGEPVSLDHDGKRLPRQSKPWRDAASAKRA